MLGAAIIVFRETLEAALLIGIVAAAGRSIPGRARWIGGGVLAGGVGAVLVALGASRIALLFEGVGQELFNAAVLGIAVVLLGWHQIWMSAHGAELASDAHRTAREVEEGRSESSALFAVIALAVLREGSESALFLYGLTSGGGTGAAAVASGGVVGLLAGAALGALLYAGMLRIPLRWFFAVTSGLILLLAAGMASKMTQLLMQADILHAMTSPLWDTSSFLSGESALGVLMHALAGYDPRPAAAQVASYALTIAVILAGAWLVRRRNGSAR